MSATLFKIWICFTLAGILLSVFLDHIFREAMGLDFLSQIEIFSAVWFVILGLALIRYEKLLSKIR
ncbi:MAG: hypothetical protein HLUCCO03_04330 [Marinobacter sp. HL-58]|nr:MAG: hypothetical protein HLUCCO03_04330 [Marinobacter sp. HL-58]